MTNPFFEHPILNSPYERPGRHWELDESGQPTQTIVPERRQAKFVTPIPKSKKRKATSQQGDLGLKDEAGETLKDPNYETTSIINLVRAQVDTWRELKPNQWQVTPETQRLSEAFIRLGEIENQIRRLIRGKFTPADMQVARDPTDADREVKDASDLTFGEYVRLFENPTSWSKLGLSLDRAAFVGRLNDVRRIRNEVMHFHPDGIEDEEREILRRTSRFLQQL